MLDNRCFAIDNWVFELLTRSGPCALDHWKLLGHLKFTLFRIFLQHQKDHQLRPILVASGYMLGPPSLVAHSSLQTSWLNLFGLQLLGAPAPPLFSSFFSRSNTKWTLFIRRRGKGLEWSYILLCKLLKRKMMREK